MSERAAVQTATPVPSSAARAASPVRLLRRKCGCGGDHEGECDECRKKRMGTVQRSAIDAASLDRIPQEVDEELARAGTTLEPGVRRFMEQRFGHDFGTVRVHSNARAAASADAVRARAYTVGSDVVFAAGQYQPETGEGRRLLAHELTHVVQQSGSASPAADSATAEARDEAEAVRAEHMVAASSPAPVAVSSSPGSALRRQGGGTQGQPAPKKPSAIEKLTHLTFHLGDATFEIDLPSSVSATLPIELSGRTKITFALKGTTSGAFTFTATLDGIPHVRIIAKAGVEVGDKSKATAGITVEATRKVCRVKNEGEMRKDLQSAGDKLKSAIVDFQKLPDALAGVSDEVERAKIIGTRAGAVGSAIGAVNSAIEKAKAPCKETPVFSFDFGVQAPLQPAQPDFFGPGSSAPPMGPSVGATFTWHF